MNICERRFSIDSASPFSHFCSLEMIREFFFELFVISILPFSWLHTTQSSIYLSNTHEHKKEVWKSRKSSLVIGKGAFPSGQKKEIELIIKIKRNEWIKRLLLDHQKKMSPGSFVTCVFLDSLHKINYVSCPSCLVVPNPFSLSHSLSLSWMNGGGGC